MSDLPEVPGTCPGLGYTSDQVAEYWHRMLVKAAPRFGTEIREEYRGPWENLSPNHRQLLRAVAAEVMQEFFPEHVLFQ
jgi:hypothetical protein